MATDDRRSSGRASANRKASSVRLDHAHGREHELSIESMITGPSLLDWRSVSGPSSRSIFELYGVTSTPVRSRSGNPPWLSERAR